MALIVQKYGGTSMGSIERIEHVAGKIAATRAQGHQVVVVVSAMSGETDRLIKLAKSIHARGSSREMDQIAATGEQVAIGLLALALEKIGVPARSYTGAQVAIRTDDAHTKARIQGIDAERLGARGIGIHSLRKTALNNAIQNGAQMHEVRELAGHSDIRTTELYFARKEEDAERAARRIQIR